jgi:hypothetical protein
MTNKTPKGPVPSLIGSTMGRPRRVRVERKSECKRCGVGLEAGKECIAIPKLGGAFQNLRRYCEKCYRAILEKTESDLETLRVL